MSETLFVWRTTQPHPGVIDGWKRSHAHGADQGQVGWKLHAVVLKHDREEYDEGFRPAAMCGCNPRWGWALDLFINDECSRCQSAMTKREATGEKFFDLDVRRRAEREAAEREEYFKGKATHPANQNSDWPFPKD